MEIVFDEPKRLANLNKHGVDFATLDLEFFLHSKVVPAREGRVKALGLHKGRYISVIFKPLGVEAISIISMRRASKNERPQV